ncbi:MAG: sigma-54 dependent transcriptional regulator [Gammaproteobacteria bacterium]|nr:sigma-54 dependent transcriptional regulator [Gammaproteobacteria bacterium]
MNQHIFSRDLIGNDPAFQSVVNTTSLIAATDVTVHIMGESGTGKELIARAIHDASPRHNAPFVSINCAAIPENLAESELFGHSRGAFTGADKQFGGRILEAHGGTLFLDEIGELPMPVQSKLLRFLESREIQPLGNTRAISVDARILTATNRNLKDMVKTGYFREDLYYRLSVVPVQLPSLRERSSDVPVLLRHLTQQHAQTHQLAEPVYTKEALKIIQRYNWPGNVRELRNFAERMLILFSGREVLPGNLPAEMKSSAPEHGLKKLFKLPESGISLNDLERSLFEQALETANGNQSRAARLLGISRDTFLYRMKKYHL